MAVNRKHKFSNHPGHSWWCPRKPCRATSKRTRWRLHNFADGQGDSAAVPGGSSGMCCADRCGCEASFAGKSKLHTSCSPMMS